MPDLDYLEGRKLCIVFVQVLDEETGRLKLQAMHGRASVENGKLALRTPQGTGFPIPNTALASIMPSDGTPILKDAEYYCFVKTDPGIGLFDDEPSDE